MTDQMATSLPHNIQSWVTAVLLPAVPGLSEQIISFLSTLCKSIPPSELDSSLQAGTQLVDILLTVTHEPNILLAGLGHPTLKAGFLSDQLSHPNTHKQSDMPEAVLKLWRGLLRMKILDSLLAPQKQFSQAQADNLRKMVLTMVDDIRLVLIQLAEQLRLLKNARGESPQKQKILAEQTFNLYAPLANRLGIGQLKWQLEDLALRFKNPDSYHQLSKALKLRRLDRESYIQQIITHLRTLLHQHHITPAEVMGRAKHIYSIYCKLNKKHLELSQIYDTLALRILVPRIEDCYLVLSLIYETWTPIPSEFDDYIAHPKPNGYQSLHLAVQGPQQQIIEIQIRTPEMHQFAELGVAAHWVYKEGRNQSSDYHNKINWLRQLLAWQQDLNASDANQPATTSANFFSAWIYVFTPNNDIIELEKNATPLDFAYRIHTQIGHRCRGAKINGKLSPLNTPLRTGDRIEIVTGKEAEPSRDWINPHLNYLITHAARQKVQHWFRQQDYERYLSLGQAIWEKNTRQVQVDKSVLPALLKQLNYHTLEDVLAAIGGGEITCGFVLNKWQNLANKNSEPTLEAEITNTATTKPHPTTGSNSEHAIQVAGLGQALTQLAKCCHPIPGDDITGYITKGRGVSVHRLHCRNLIQARAHHPERFIAVSWTTTHAHYPMRILIIARYKNGLIRDISHVMAENNIALQQLTCHVDKLNSIASIMATIELPNTALFNKVVQQLKQVDEIINVSRYAG